MTAEGSLTKHGFPRGYRFVPTQLELISLLTEHIHGAGLPTPLDAIFHEISILDYHPEELYERFKDDAEHRYIYFFSMRAFQKPGTGGVVSVPEDKDQKEPRPVRMARGGGWKPSGGGQVLRWPGRMGRFVAGRMVTMVFYDRSAAGPVKSNWGMHEFIVPVDRKLTSLPSKYTRFYDLALYRLYILKSGDIESETGSPSSIPMLPYNSVHFPTSASMTAPCPPMQPCGIFTGNQHLLAAGASTSSSQMPPHQQLPSPDYKQYYHHYTFGATATGAAAAAQKQIHTMPMPVLAAGLPGNSCHFAVPPAPRQAPVAQRTGQEAGGHSGPTCSPPAIGRPAEEQHATVMADCVKPKEEEEEEAAPPQVEDVAAAPAAAKEEERTAEADGYDGLGNPDWSSIDLDDCFLFTIDEILRSPVFDDLPVMEGAEGDNNNNNSGGENGGQAAGIVASSC